MGDAALKVIHTGQSFHRDLENSGTILVLRGKMPLHYIEAQ